jgi:exonuclease SbcC
MWQAGRERPLTLLSGRETFLALLALASSVADSRTVKMPIETLLRDEGFGTLDREMLQVAMCLLEALQSTRVHVGLITHVEQLREHIDARVTVEKQGNRPSRVRTERATGWACIPADDPTHSAAVQ